MSILESMWGLVIGDALGEPVEGMWAHQIREMYGRIEGFLGFPQVTDDSILSMLVARCVIENRGLVDRRLIARTFLDNRGQLRRLGPTTTAALHALEEDSEFLPRTGTTNGAAMRAPVMGWLRRDPDIVVRDTVESSFVTHGTDVALAGACAIACAVSAAIEGHDPVAAALWGARMGQQHGAPVGPNVEELIRGAVELARRRPLNEVAEEYGAGIETHESVPLAVATASVTSTFEEAVFSVVNLGGDTDTIAAMTGAITGPRGVPDHLKFDAPWDIQKIALELLRLRIAP